MKKIIKLTALLLCLCLITAIFVSCASKGEPLITLEDKVLTVNQYQLLLSRMKGTLARQGGNVESESFWRTVISADGTTYEEYFTDAILEEARRYVIAAYLFDQNGLQLDGETENRIDTLMDKLAENAGSKSALNGILKEYGVNMEMLRELYVMEAKVGQLKDHLYGENGSKIPQETKEVYLAEHYVAFGQIFLATYYYQTDVDEFGDTVYYTDDKHTAVAYDKANGETVTNEFGKTVTDLFGDPVYYNDLGRVAYDKENGVVGYVTDQDGDKIPVKYDDAAVAELYKKAYAYKDACNRDIDLFREFALYYDESDSEAVAAHHYLYSGAGYYSAQGSGFAYLDKIAETLKELDAGECAVVQSNFGYHIVCKYEFEDSAWALESQKEVFSDFFSSLCNELFAAECAKLEGRVVVDSDALGEAPRISEVPANTLY